MIVSGDAETVLHDRNAMRDYFGDASTATRSSKAKLHSERRLKRYCAERQAGRTNRKNDEPGSRRAA